MEDQEAVLNASVKVDDVEQAIVDYNRETEIALLEEQKNNATEFYKNILKKFDDYINYLDGKDIPTASDTEVMSAVSDYAADTVKDEMRQAIDDTVYSTYEPEYYKRRGEQGGLLDEDNITVTELENGILLRNTAPLDNDNAGYDLDRIVIDGSGNQPFPRDFIEETKERLEDNKAHVEAMVQGLRKKGYDVK